MCTQVAEAATPRVRSSDDESDDEAEPTEAGSNKRSRVATRVDDLVSAVTSLREERDRSVRVAASLNRKLSTLMREQRYGSLLHYACAMLSHLILITCYALHSD